MKSFVSTLAAILVAAGLIFGLKAIIEQRERTKQAYEALAVDNAKADAWIAASKRDRWERMTRAPKPEFVTLIGSATPDGQTILEKGTKLQFVGPVDAASSDDIIVIYDGKKLRIPAWITDLE